MWVFAITFIVIWVALALIALSVSLIKANKKIAKLEMNARYGRLGKPENKRRPF